MAFLSSLLVLEKVSYSGSRACSSSIPTPEDLRLLSSWFGKEKRLLREVRSVKSHQQLAG